MTFSKKVLAATGVLGIIVILFFVLGSTLTTKGSRVVLDSMTNTIVGQWRSTDDLKSEITFAKDGITTDVYDNETLGTGTWYIVNKIDESEDVYNPTGIFLYKNFEEEEFVYAIVSMSEDRLVLNYLARGNTLEYTRLK